MPTPSFPLSALLAWTAADERRAEREAERRARAAFSEGPGVKRARNE